MDIYIYIYIYISIYILGKSVSPYTNASLFLIIRSKNYIFYPKITLMKSGETVIFVRKVSQGSRYSKIVNSTQPFLLPCDVVVVLLGKLLCLIHRHCRY